MKYKDIEKFFNSSICLILVFLILAQPCFAFGPTFVNPASLPPINLTPSTNPELSRMGSLRINSANQLSSLSLSKLRPHLQYTDVGGTVYQNDQNGNLASDGVYTFDYDYENRLISAVGNGHNSSYEYDGFGRRISKTVDGLVTYFVYDGDQIIAEYDSSGALIKEYTYGSGIDEILTSIQYPASSIYYYFFDGLGSVTDITDSSGEVVESYNYDVYGLPNQTSTIGNRFYFTGRELDEETGLYYYRARHYSPTIGRFLQRDPITWAPNDSRLNNQINLQISSLLLAGLSENFGALDIRSSIYTQQLQNILKTSTQNQQLLHPYSYTFNNPANFVDPQGTFVWWPVITGFAGGFLSAWNEMYHQNWNVGSVAAAFGLGFVAGALAPAASALGIAHAIGLGFLAGALNNVSSSLLRSETPCPTKTSSAAIYSSFGSLIGYAVGTVLGSPSLGLLIGMNYKVWGPAFTN